MERSYQRFGIIVFLLAVIFLPPTPSHASDIVGATNIQVKQETWKSGNIGETITGTLTDAGRSDYNSPGTTVTLRYLYDPDASNVDLNSFGYKYYGGTEPVLGTNLEYSTDCTVNANKATVGQPGYNDFTCQTLDQNLNSGIYVFAIGGNGTVTWNSYIDNMDFTITGGATPPATVSPSVNFVSAAVTGTGVDVKLNAFNVPVVVQAYITLGTATEQGTTANYSCLPGTKTSSAITIAPTTGSSPTLIESTFTSLNTGIYCIGLNAKSSAGTIVTVQATGADANGYFDEPGSLFTIGNATIVPGATLNPTANPLGCSTPTTGTSVNTGYCLLAPLPGVGDPTTGLLNVSTGIGNYFNAIIKLVMGLIGVLAVLMIVVGGIEYMATVSITEKEGAKNRIINALLGLLIALGSYIILNTINPHLTNLSVTVNQVQVTLGEDQGVESDETGTLPTNLPPVTGITVPTGSAQALAQQILQNSNITLDGVWGQNSCTNGQCGNDPASTPMQNITDTAAGKAASTSISASFQNGGVKQTPLSVKMLAGILAVAEEFPITITAIEGSVHTAGSAHYTGRAFDVQADQSDAASSLPHDKAIGDACRAAGASLVITPCAGNYGSSICAATGYATNTGHRTHVHCQWSS